MHRDRLAQRAVPATLVALAVALFLIWIVARAASGGPSRDVPGFQHVVVVLLENESYSEVVGSPEAPELNGLARQYGLLTNFFAVAHPSLPNYLALVSGSTQGVTTEDCEGCEFPGRTIADSIDESNRTWKVYAEGLPARGFRGAASGQYVRRHNPFMYFGDVVGSPDRLDRIAPLSEFSHDLATGNLPSFSFVVPGLCNSVHDCSLAQGDSWVGSFVKPLLASDQMKDSVVFVTFDESESEDIESGGGHIPLFVLGPLVKSGARSSVRVTHYGLLRTIEDAWNLPPLGRSATAKPITGIWR